MSVNTNPIELKRSRFIWLLVLLFMAVPLACNAVVAPAYERLAPISTSLSGPVGVALDAEGHLYVAETSANRVVVLSQNGNYISSLNGLAAPISVAVDNDGRLYVGNKTTNNVEVYDGDFNLRHKLGSGNGEFAQPNGISIDLETGLVYVADKGNGIVKVFDATGAQVNTIGSPGNGNGQFHNPLSVAIDLAKQELVVLDLQQVSGSSEEGARIQFFDMNGVYKRSFSRYNTVEGDMIRPQQLTVDGASRVYVTDSFQNVVLVYDGDGTSLGAVYDLVNPVSVPLGVTIDVTNRLYVASRLADRIEVYGIDDYTRMAVDPMQLSFTGKEGNAAPAAQNIAITNTGNATLSWSAVSNESWLGLSDTNGILDAGQTATFPVTVDTSSLAPGEYPGSVVISGGPGVTEVVQVKLEIEPSRILSVTSSGLSFTSETGTAPTTSGTITIANAGSASMFWQVAADQPWITLSGYSGRLANAATPPATVMVTVDVLGLAAGPHTGTITVSGYDAIASPTSLDVTLTLTDPPVVKPPTPAERVFSDMTWDIRDTIPPITLNGIWSSSGSQVYAVGQSGTILHFNGSEWSVMDSGTSQDLYSVWGSLDADDGCVAVYAVGTGGTILQYAGSGDAWTVMESGGSNLTGVWGASANDVYAVGQSGTILHYNGSSWSAMSSPTGNDLDGVWGSSGTDVYAVGQKGTIVQYNGTSWSEVSSPTRSNLYGVWGDGSSVYAVGQRGTLLKGSVNSWVELDSGTRSDLNSIWASSASDIYTVGSGGTIVHYDGESWMEMYSPVSRDLHGVWGGSQRGVYAVGENLSLLYYDYSSWQPVSLVSSMQDLYGVWGSAADDVYAVGLAGLIRHYDGEEWHSLDAPVETDLYGVWGRSPSEIFAVGAGGAILRYNGSTWSPFYSPADNALYGIWGTETDLFAVGGKATVMHYDGTVWEPLKVKGADEIYGVWGRSASDVYLVGQRGSIQHYDGTGVSSMVSPTDNDLFGVVGCPDGGLFAVGHDGVFLRYDGSSWTSLDSGTNSSLYGVWCSSATDVFLVGQDDTFLYYDGSMNPADFGAGGWLRGVWGSSETTDVFAVGSGGATLHGKNE